MNGTTVLTSYYANIKNIPNDYTLISISGGITPEIEKVIDIHDKSLAPSLSIFKEYKDGYDTELYTKRFRSEVLPKVDLNKKLVEWAEKTTKDKNKFVLLCYETPKDFCHRHLVAEEFLKYGVIVKEYKQPEEETSLNDF